MHRKKPNKEKDLRARLGNVNGNLESYYRHIPPKYVFADPLMSLQYA